MQHFYYLCAIFGGQLNISRSTQDSTYKPTLTLQRATSAISIDNRTKKLRCIYLPSLVQYLQLINKKVPLV